MEGLDGFKMLSDWGVLGIMLIYFILRDKHQAEERRKDHVELQKQYLDREKVMSDRLNQLEDCYRTELVEVVRENTSVIGQNQSVMKEVVTIISKCSGLFTTKL